MTSLGSAAVAAQAQASAAKEFKVLDSVASADKVTPVFFAFHLKKQTWARAYINDLPAYKGIGFGPDSDSATANDLLIPGENTLTIEILKVGEISDEELSWQVKAEVYEVLDLDSGRIDQKVKRRMIFETRFPDMMATVDERFRRVPFYYRGTFDPGVPLVSPPWLKAPTTSFESSGTPDMRDAVQRVYDAIAARDAERFIDELALKFDYYEKAHHGHAATTADKAGEHVRELFGYRPMARPLDFAELHFEPRQGGRVAHVSRLDGGWALDVPCELDPNRCIQADILLMQQGGKWRVVG